MSDEGKRRLGVWPWAISDREVALLLPADLLALLLA
jgi:hypothetical protein